jgi:hypothetical protein
MSRRVGLAGGRLKLWLVASFVAALLLPACDPSGGVGSIHIDRDRTSVVVVPPNRKVPAPDPPKGRRSRMTPKTSSPRH